MGLRNYPLVKSKNVSASDPGVDLHSIQGWGWRITILLVALNATETGMSSSEMVHGPEADLTSPLACIITTSLWQGQQGKGFIFILYHS